MNKKLIALAVAAASISSVANAAEVYSDENSSLAVGGRFESRLALEDGDVTDNTRARINFAGKTDITDSVYGIGFFEREFRGDDAKDENRHVYAGIGGNFGQVVYGKTDGSVGVITDFTDIMSYHGNNAGVKIDAADRTENNLAYAGSFDLGGDLLSVKANYVFDDGSTTTGAEVDGYSASAIYAMEMGLAFGAGYGEQKVVGEDKEKQAFAAISYTYGDFYVAGLYQDARNFQADKSRGYEFAAAYTYGNTVFTGTYNYLEDTDASGSDADLVDAFAIDATHYFNKNFRTYISYNFDQIKGADDELVLGARYDF